ncbi:uncharacterized protein [Oscarella lobularis]|uniref:uncharacterized protein n=1 Tax=Oscarella lobularis TaxID=121494 RepID=UPI003313806C
MIIVEHIVLAFALSSLALVEAARQTSKECTRERRFLERYDPRFKIRPGTVTCNIVRRRVSKCGGIVSVPSTFSDAVYYGSTGTHYTLLKSQQNGRAQCALYRPLQQCTWRFAVPPSRDAQIAFWKVAIEHSVGCKHDYIVIDVIVDATGSTELPPRCEPLRGKGKHYRSRQLCRIEYRLPCGAYCDPVLADDACWSSFTCVNDSESCRKKIPPWETFSFNFSTSERPELRGLNVKFIHVTFRSDSTRECRGFEGIYVDHPKRWRGQVALAGNENENDFSAYLEGLGEVVYEKGREFQKYNATDLLIALSKASQNATFMKRLKKHKAFKSFVRDQQHGLPLTMQPDDDDDYEDLPTTSTNSTSAKNHSTTAATTSTNATSATAATATSMNATSAKNHSTTAATTSTNATSAKAATATSTNATSTTDHGTAATTIRH